jgi:3-oxoacyl-[acyl-carrier protein] reductase
VRLSLQGRRAVVPAASTGLGFAAAAALAEEGARVVICGRDAARVDEAVDRLGPGARGIVADVGTVAGAAELMTRAEEALEGPIEVLVLNGPGPKPGNFATIESADYARGVEGNLLAPIEMCCRAVPAMRERGWGRVVAITSVAVRQPISNLIVSNTARTGLTAFLKSLALETAGEGVTVNSVQPGLHGTARLLEVYGDRVDDEVRQIPAGRLGGVPEFGQIVAFLCSEQASYITGAGLPVDGGLYRGLM